jgi:thiamine-monophosphate kinase
LNPEPRIREALTLHRAVAIRAMIDISDGLAADLGHILEESGGRGAVLDADAIPIHPDAVTLSELDGVSPRDHALHDGEDFELCLTLDPEEAHRVLARPPAEVTLHRIGTITAKPGLWLRRPDGLQERLEPRGFDHFRD